MYCRQKNTVLVKRQQRKNGMIRDHLSTIFTINLNKISQHNKTPKNENIHETKQNKTYQVVVVERRQGRRMIPNRPFRQLPSTKNTIKHKKNNQLIKSCRFEKHTILVTKHFFFTDFSRKHKKTIPHLRQLVELLQVRC